MGRLDRRLKMGMVGGGPGAFIGDVHRRAACLDGAVELVAGAFSADARKSAQKGRELRLEPGRVYGSYEAMIDNELALPDGERIDFVSIVTPNHLHYPIAKAFLQAGFHVVCDKPMTFDVGEARKLRRQVEKSPCVFALTHNYTGYPMVKLARDLVRRGALGRLRKIVAQYPQGWLATPLERTGMKQAAWRTDPKRSGAAGCIGDIGTHAENLAEYVTGLRITELCADLTTFVQRRRLDDDGNVLVRFEGGARGVLFASQISIGEENGLALWVYGDRKGLEWHQEEPNTLRVKMIARGAARSLESGQRLRPGGQSGGCPGDPFAPRPSGSVPGGVRQRLSQRDRRHSRRAPGEEPEPLALDFPTAADGLRGMLFIEAVVKSARSKQKWVRMPKA